MPMQANSERLQLNSRTLILVVDDDSIFREAIVSFLRRQSFVTLEAADAQTAYELATANETNVAIVDVVLPERPLARPIQDQNQGIELARRLKRFDPAMAVILFSAFGDRSDAVLQLAVEGVRGLAYLTKGYRSGTSVLMQALEETRAGHIMIRSDHPGQSTSLAERFWSRLSPRETPYIRRAIQLFPTLTRREREVAFALAQAQTVQGSADTLNITEGTTEKHINHIYGKLELDRADLEEPPLRKSILLAKVCWLIDMMGGRDGP